MKILPLLLLLSTSVWCQAQITDATESATVLWANERRLPDPDPIFSEDHYVLPFTMAGRLIILEATIDTMTGSFNFWDESALKMQKDSQGWYIDYYLAPGKHTYKFKVDEEWLRDPQNKLWEDNAFDTGNSVIWIHPDDKIPTP